VGDAMLEGLGCFLLRAVFSGRVDNRLHAGRSCGSQLLIGFTAWRIRNLWRSLSGSHDVQNRRVDRNISARTRCWPCGAKQAGRGGGI